MALFISTIIHLHILNTLVIQLAHRCSGPTVYGAKNTEIYLYENRTIGTYIHSHHFVSSSLLCCDFDHHGLNYPRCSVSPVHDYKDLHSLVETILFTS